MRVNQLKAGTTLAYLQMALQAIISLAYTPFLVEMLGQSEYGLYATVLSTVSMLSILNLGLGNGYIKYYSTYKKNGDNESIYKLNGLFLTIFSVLGMVVLCVGLFFSFHLELVFDSGFTAQEYATAKILFILLTINLTITFPMNTFSCIITAHERFLFHKLAGMIRTVASPLLTLPLLFFGFKSIALVAVTISLALVNDLFYVGYVFGKLHQKFIFSHFEKGLLKRLMTFTSFVAINLIVDQINSNFDKLLLGRYCGTAAVAVYSIGYTFYTYYSQFSVSVSSVFAPRVHRIVAETQDKPQQQKERLTALFTKVGRIQFMVLALVASGLVLFGKAFIVDHWVGPEYITSYYVALIIIIPSSIALVQNVGIQVQRALNLHQFRSIIYMVMALINLVVSIILIKSVGPIGAPVGTAISLILANGLIMNVFYHKRCSLDILRFWKSILTLARGLVVPLLFGVLIIKHIDLSSVFAFLGTALTYTVVYFVSMWIWGMNESERALFAKPANKIIKKFRG